MLGEGEVIREASCQSIGYGKEQEGADISYREKRGNALSQDSHIFSRENIKNIFYIL